MKKSIKRTLDNNVSTKFDVTQRELYNEIENAKVGEFVKIEYIKKIKASDRRRFIKTALESLSQLPLKDVPTEGFRVLNKAYNALEGEHRVGYYKRVEDFRDESGYIRFQDENDNWKKVYVPNIISLTNSNGVKLTRHEQG